MVTMAVLVLGGACLVLWGLRGKRLDEHPVCRACGFDLSGLRGKRDAGQSPRADGPEGIRICPECGRSLDQASAIIVGNRRRRPAAVLVGSVMLLGGMIPAASVLPWLQTAWWIANKPAWMLELDTYVASSTGTALSELARRRGAGELSDAALARVARHGLAIQADRSIPWDMKWGDLIGAADGVAGLLTEEEKVAMVRNAIKVDVPMVDRCRVGDTVSLIHQVEVDRGFYPGSRGVDVQAVFDWGGVRTVGGRNRFSGLTPGTSSAGVNLPVPELAPGAHAGTAEITLTSLDGLGAPFGKPWIIAVPFSLNVFARGSEIVTCVNDEALLKSAGDAVSVSRVSIDPTLPAPFESRKMTIMAVLMVKKLPITIVSQLRAVVRPLDAEGATTDGIARSGERVEVSFGSPIRLDATGQDDPGMFRGFVSEEVDRVKLRKLGKRVQVDFILTADAKSAAEFGCWRILGNELKITGVVVEFDEEDTPAPAAR